MAYYPQQSRSPTLIIAVAALKITLYIGIGVFLILILYGLGQLYIDMDFHEFHHPFLITSSICIIPLLIIFLGLYGAYHEHKPTLLMFSSLIGLHALFCMSFLIFLHTSMETQQPTLDFVKDLGSSMEYYEWTNLTPEDTRTPDHEDTWAWDETQQGLRCCGVLSPHDWDKQLNRPITQPGYPKSCCDNPILSEGFKICNPWTTYQIGCKEALENRRVRLIIILVFLILIQLLLSGTSQLFCLKRGELDTINSRKRNRADDIWTRFVSAQYNPTIQYAKTRSKSCGVILTSGDTYKVV